MSRKFVRSGAVVTEPVLQSGNSVLPDSTSAPGAGLRVLTITNLYPSPARPDYGSFIASQVASLRAEGVDTDVYVIDGRRTRNEYLWAFPRIASRIARGGYHLVHAHYGFSACYPLLVGRLPVVVSFLGDDLLVGHERLSWLKARVRDFVAVRASAVIVKTEEMRRTLGRDGVHVIPNGVDLDLFRPLDRADCRRILGYESGKRYVLFPYDTARKVKDFRLAAAAFDLLRRALPDAEMKIVTRECPGRMPLHYNAADLLLFTSLREGSPNTVKEALACNGPVVATPCGDVEERLRGVRGCAVVERSAEALARAMLTILESPDPRSDGRLSVATLEAGLVARKLIAIYRSLAG